MISVEMARNEQRLELRIVVALIARILLLGSIQNETSNLLNGHCVGVRYVRLCQRAREE